MQSRAAPIGDDGNAEFVPLKGVRDLTKRSAVLQGNARDDRRVMQQNVDQGLGAIRIQEYFAQPAIGIKAKRHLACGMPSRSNSCVSFGRWFGSNSRGIAVQPQHLADPGSRHLDAATKPD